MKALVIAPQPFFSPRGTPLSVYYRTLIAAELGVDVDLLTYGQGQNVVIPGVRIIRIPSFRFLGNVKVGPSYLKLFLDIILFIRMVRLMTKNDYDVVHAHEEAVLLCLPLKRIFGFRLIYDMHSSLPAQLINFQFVRANAIVAVFNWLERLALNSADVVITICEDLYVYAAQVIGAARKVFLIENSIYEPVRLATSTEPNEDVLERVHGRQLIVYTGTMEPYQGIDLALKAFRIVANHDAMVVLLLAGGSARQVQQYSRMADTLGIGNRCYFVGSVSKEEAQRYTTKADVLISPRVAGTNTPLKLYEQLASGIPIVATNIHAHTQVLTTDVALLVAPDAESLAAGLLRALRNESEGRIKARNAQRLYQVKYSRSQYTAKMKRVMEEVS